MQIADTTVPTLITITPVMSPLATSDEFGDVLATASGPPGADPPPLLDTKPTDRELKTNEPNAQSDKPDPLQKKKEEEPKPDPSLLPTIAAATAALVPTPTPATAPSATLGKAGEADMPANKPKAEVPGISLNALPKVPEVPIVSAKSAIVSDTSQAPKIGQGLRAQPEPTTAQVPGQAKTGETPIPSVDKQIKLADGLDLKEIAPKVDSKESGTVPVLIDIPPIESALGSQSKSGMQQNAGQFGAQQQSQAQQVQGISEISGIGAAGSVSNAAILDAVKTAANHLSEMALKKSVEQVTVQLKPLDLGSITLQVRNVRGHVDAKITTESEAVKQALQQNRQQLEQAVAAKGMQLGRVNVSFESGDRGANRQPKGQPQRPQPSIHHEPASVKGQPAGTRFAASKPTGVDIWI